MVLLDDDDMWGFHTFEAMIYFKGLFRWIIMLEVYVAVSEEVIQKNCGILISFGSNNAIHLCH